MTTTPNLAQCYDETGRPIDTGQRCAETPAGPSAPVTICEDGTPCPTTTATVTTTTTSVVPAADRTLPSTGVGFEGAGLGLALVLFGAVLVRAVRRPA